MKSLILIVGVIMCPCLLVPSSAQSCNYEKLIHQLEQERANDPMQDERTKAMTKYLGARRDLDEFDSYSQFTFTSDQDAKAKLKFDTPEEKFRDAISSILSWLTWLSGHAEKFTATMYDAGTLANAKKSLDILQKLDKQVRDVKKLMQVEKDKAEKLWQEYWRLVEMRVQTLAQLDKLSEDAMCQYLNDAEWQLAKLYHEVIPNDESCNGLLKKAMLDRIARIGGVGMGYILEKKNYDRLKSKCPPVTLDKVAEEEKVTSTDTEEKKEKVQLYAERWSGNYYKTKYYYSEGSATLMVRWYDDGSVVGRFRDKPITDIQINGSSYKFTVISSTCKSLKVEFTVEKRAIGKEALAYGTYYVDCPETGKKEYPLKMTNYNATEDKR